MKYKVIKDSGHTCCFEASVVDASTYDNADCHTTDDAVAYKVICECSNIETAEMIAEALNKQEELK